MNPNPHSSFSTAKPVLRKRVQPTPDEPVIYTLVSTPLGTLGVVASLKGLCLIEFHPVSPTFFKETVTSLYGGEPLHDPGGFKDIRSEIEAYFSGSSAGFKVRIDLSRVSGFQEKVLCALRAIPFGQTLSYSSLASLIGHPRAYRAVGTACGRNPVPLIIPCHRVTGRNQSLGGFSGGLDTKRWLLRHERSDFIETPKKQGEPRLSPLKILSARL